MSREKILCERDMAMEEHSHIQLEACTAYVYEDRKVKVMGEAVAQDNSVKDEYKTIQVILYDADGDIVDRAYTNWMEFGLRQSFELKFSNLDEVITKVKVYPSNE